MFEKPSKVVLLLLLLCPPDVFAALDQKALAQKVQSIQKSTSGKLGVGVYDLKTGQAWYLNGDKQFPMHSVAKVPMTIAALLEVDRGKLKLDSEIPVSKSDVLAIRAGAMPDNLPLTTKTCSLISLMERAICKSNNGSADVLMRIAGGPQAVNKIFQQNSINGIRVDRYEGEIIQPRADKPVLDTSTPRGAIDLLVKLQAGKILSPGSTQVLLKLMEESKTGDHRLKAGFPSTAKVAHKTGTGRKRKEICVATNDVGIVTKQNGDIVMLAVFLANAPGSDKQRDDIIAGVARSVYEASR